MKRFTLVALVAALLFSMVTSVSATELKVKGDFNVYGMWSANLNDFDSNNGDGDNYFTDQRLRTYFTFMANENLKAVLGLEINNIWGDDVIVNRTTGQRTSTGGGWGTDGVDTMRVKHAYLDFNYPGSDINIKAGLQYVALPSVFGNPVFDDDAAALVISAPINDMFGVAVGYSRGNDDSTNVSANPINKDDVDMAFLAVPVTLDGFSVTPYFAYGWLGENSGSAFDAGDDSTVWVLGANAELTMFDPLTFAADLIYGQGEGADYETKGWYAALAASYKFEMLTATLFSTYFTGADDDDDDNMLPQLAEGWGISPYIGGVRAFSTRYDTFSGVDNANWAIGLQLADITFVENLTHKLVIAYAQGTSDSDSGVAFDEDASAWEVYFVNKYMIYENLAAINELGYFAPDFDDSAMEDDASYFATVGFQYKF